MRSVVWCWIRKFFRYEEEENYIFDPYNQIPKKDKKLLNRAIRYHDENAEKRASGSKVFKIKDLLFVPPVLFKPAGMKNLNDQTEDSVTASISEPPRDPIKIEDGDASGSSEDFMTEPDKESLEYGSETVRTFNELKSEIYEYMKEYRNANYDLWTTKPFTYGQHILCEEIYRRYDCLETISNLALSPHLKNMPKNDIIAWVAWRTVCQRLPQ